jgi:Outer membrane protein beta-barrel domain
MKKLFYLTIFILLQNTEGLYSQSRFRATGVIGLNFTQLDGDLQQGYHKKGASLGLSSAIIIKPDFDISLEAFYNQRGARPISVGTSQESRYRTSIDINYADIVTLFNFHAFPSKSKQYYIQTLKIGFSYGKLLNSRIDMRYNNIKFTEYEQQILKGIKKDDISLVLGLAWQITPQLGVMFRHSNSLRRIYENKQPLSAPSPSFIPISHKDIRYLNPYHFSLHTFYHFVSPHKVIGVRKNKRGGSGGDPLEEL